MSKLSMGSGERYLNALRKETGDLLEKQFRMDINTKDKILDEYFSKGYLPRWYFYSNSADTIAHHIYMLTHFLNANNDMLSQSGVNSNSKTYFINVGRDYPGRLARIVERNLPMGIVGLDSEATASGLRILTIDKRGEHYVAFSEEDREGIKALKEKVLAYGRENNLKYASEFLETLSRNYLREELAVQSYPERIFRHLHLFEEALKTEQLVADSAIIKDTLRLSLAALNPHKDFIFEVLKYFKWKRINLSRTYYDLLESKDYQVGIVSLYIANPAMPYKELEKIMNTELAPFVNISSESSSFGTAGASGENRDLQIENLIKKMSSPLSEKTLNTCLNNLKDLCRENLKPGKEMGNFYLNSVTDFLEAASIIGLDKSPAVLKILLGFERFDEFFVTCPKDGKSKNVPGYRIKHSTLRGASKGGLRIDPIVNFCEVAALSFMMTWKCARSRILFGGAKGGLMLNPRSYDPRSMDFFDSLSNFGRSLFLVTGPAKDVPAGDVGCGADEIGRMFEGFKSALRDLALMVYGVRHNVTMIGDQIISLEEARTILAEAFNIDHTDSRVLKELGANQDYLELVVAAQITGKPRMGIDARTGATGRGLCYATLSAVANLYLDGKWEASEKLDSKDEKLLKSLAAVDGDFILKKGGMDILNDQDWEALQSTVFPKLLKDKKVVVQGSGKVGSSIMKELSAFGINLIAVADAGGAVVGDHLDYEDLMASVKNSMEEEDRALRATVIHAKKGVNKLIKGAREGSVVLELPCDIVFPAALENAVTEVNAPKIKAKIEVCGSNGSNSSKAEKILHEKGVLVVYDFLANSAGVTASYFEWLRNLYQRSRYEAENIYEEDFDDKVMDRYIMPEFKERIKQVLAHEESDEVTALWNTILRDIMFSAVNEDYRQARDKGISMKSAGFINTQMRVLAAAVSRMEEEEASALKTSLPGETAALLEEFLKHPEVDILNAQNHLC